MGMIEPNMSFVPKNVANIRIISEIQCRKAEKVAGMREKAIRILCVNIVAKDN